MNPRTVALDACAKVNLRLIVLGREMSGYHSLETLFCGISLADSVEVTPGPPGIDLHLSGGIDTGPPEKNLVTRAAERFLDVAGIPPALRIHLHKRIPSAAGLGGGSSDAAAILRILSELYDHPLSERKVLEIGTELGSDVPFFLTRTPLALGWGRGERLLELPPLPSRPVVVAHPGTPLPTAAAFARFAQMQGQETPVRPHTLPLEALGSWEGLAEHAVNDLEFVAFERIPHLTHALRTLIESGATLALLAGSGAALFGVFPSESEAELGGDALTSFGYRTWRAHTLEAWPAPRRGIDPNDENT